MAGSDSDGTDADPAADADADPAADALPSLARQTSVADGHPLVEVVVGTSAHATSDFLRRCTNMVNEAYGYGRVSQSEVANRLSMGDAGEPHTNRVLHIATRDGVLVGCCSSTKQTPWCPRGCGHWGLLVVDVAAQGTGVASALVAAAEARLEAAGLHEVQIEYEYTPGDPQSERLYKWYEGSCGFSGGSPPSGYYSSFRRCRKRLGGKKTATHGAAASPSRPKSKQSATTVGPDEASQGCGGSHKGAPTGAPSNGGCLEWLRKMARQLACRLALKL